MAKFIIITKTNENKTLPFFYGKMFCQNKKKDNFSQWDYFLLAVSKSVRFDLEMLQGGVK